MRVLADPLTANGYGLHHFGGETQSRASLQQEIEIAAGLGAKGEIVAHHHAGGATALADNLRKELARFPCALRWR